MDAIRLAGSTVDRTAIGSSVEIVANGQRQLQQLTSGDGYLASNQKTLHFGVGTATSVDQLAITWRGGRITLHKNIPCGHSYTAVGDQLFTDPQ